MPQKLFILNKVERFFGDNIVFKTKKRHFLTIIIATLIIAAEVNELSFYTITMVFCSFVVVEIVVVVFIRNE